MWMMRGQWDKYSSVVSENDSSPAVSEIEDSTFLPLRDAKIIVTCSVHKGAAMSGSAYIDGRHGVRHVQETELQIAVALYLRLM